MDKKQVELFENKSNKNDILKILGPPSTKGSFDNDLWIYIELKKVKQSVLRLGTTKIDVNNILILEVDNKGILIKKTFINKDKMNDIKFLDKNTEVAYKKTSFIYEFLSSLRHKINDPLGKRKVGSNQR